MTHRAAFRAWLMMERSATFTTAEIEQCGLSPNQARRIVSILTRSGHVECVAPKTKHRRGTFRLINDDLPRSIDSARSWQRQAWRSMRILRRFTVAEVNRTLPDPVAEYSVRRFCNDLIACGTLAVVPGLANGYRVYTVVVDSPRPATEAIQSEEVAHV